MSRAIRITFIVCRVDRMLWDQRAVSEFKPIVPLFIHLAFLFYCWLVGQFKFLSCFLLCANSLEAGVRTVPQHPVLWEGLGRSTREGPVAGITDCLPQSIVEMAPGLQHHTCIRSADFNYIPKVWQSTLRGPGIRVKINSLVLWNFYFAAAIKK